jgi:hypothetical protein
MRATEMLRQELNGALDFLREKQSAALWRNIAGVLSGQRLWLTALGRSLPGSCSDKHRIKAVDRFLGSAAIQQAVTKLYAALASHLLVHVKCPVILVDWTGGVSGFYVLSAKLCFPGRALTLLSRTFPAKRKCSPAAEREFLDELRAVIPATCKPVIVTDAGFLSKWFDCVREHGWDFVGRLRGKLNLCFEERWLTLPEVHTLARSQPRDLGRLSIGKAGLNAHRIVLSGKPKPKGRRKLGRMGLRRRSTADRQRSEAAREPWVLVTSLSDAAQIVVQAYGTRMQIEQTFRDLKSHRHGWSFEDVRSKDPKRIDVLMLIGAFAAIALHIVGLAVPQKLLRTFQANTERRRKVFSTFFLGKLIVARNMEDALSVRDLSDAVRRLKVLLDSMSLKGAAVGVMS